MCHAATKNFAGLMCARFFLGVGEAAIAPGFTLLTGMFYKREEQPMRYVPSQNHDTVVLSGSHSNPLTGNPHGSSEIASPSSSAASSPTESAT
jgi:hypothetical protein